MKNLIFLFTLLPFCSISQPIETVPFKNSFCEFKISATEVTQNQWKEVMGHLPPNQPSDCGDCPVVMVSDLDLEAFFTALGEEYRLPTRLEWELVLGSPLRDFKGGFRPDLQIKTVDLEEGKVSGMRNGVLEWLLCPIGTFQGVPTIMVAGADENGLVGWTWFKRDSRRPYVGFRVVTLK